MRKIKIGIIGLGARGSGMLKTILSFPEVEVNAVCDVYRDRVDSAVAVVKEARGTEPYATTDYNDLIKNADVEAVYVPTAWETHIEIAIACIRAGIITGVEVGGAYSVEECNNLVRAYEETGTPVMLMENCCFNKDELLATAVARSGKLGRIVHCHGAYAHDLRAEITLGNVNRHYRLRNYTSRNCENYPTHELGPIAKLLNINRGNRFVSLVSVASKACGLEDYIKAHPEFVEKDPTLQDRVFHQGDIVETIITCQNGETISLKLDTTLPRSYDREFTVRGTKGYYCQTYNSFFIDGETEHWETTKFIRESIDNAKKYEDEYLPPLWKNVTEEDLKSGHGGMDGLMLKVFFEHIESGEPMPIDVYDAASWMVITALSAQSIATGGMPQQIPDFTHGRYLLREPQDVVPLK